MGVAALGLLACAGQPPRGAAAPAEIRVLVLNMHAGTDAHGAPNLARVAALIRTAGADVVLLQEVDSATARSGRVDQLAELRRLTGLAGVFGRSLDYQGGGYGIAVLVRGQIAESRVVPLPVVPSQPRAGGSHEPRVALHATVTLGGDTVHFVNTHIDASADDVYRRQEAATLVAEAARIARAGRLVLVGGDMNSTPESAVQQAVRRAGWRDLWAECGRRGHGLTYPASQPVKRIDYLYALGGAACERAEVLESEASDHRPLVFVLRAARE